MTERPFVSVIVPVYNDVARLQLCLEALETQSYPSDRYEVLVVDNASDVPVAPMIEHYPHVLPLFERRVGAYAARNAGLQQARGGIIAFTDSDCLPAPDWLAQGIAALSNDYDVAGGWIQTVPRDPKRPTMTERYALFSSSRQQPEVLARGEAATGNLFTRRSVIDDVGAFDASFRSGSDYQWCRQARAMGKRFVAATEARVRHPAGTPYARSATASDASWAASTSVHEDGAAGLSSESPPRPSAPRFGKRRQSSEITRRARRSSAGWQCSSSRAT